MAQKYTDSVAEYKQYHLSTAFAATLSVIPMELGRTLDTLLFLDGLFSVPQKGTCGPFTFLFGLPFLLLGALAGIVTQLLIDIPSYIGYILDLSISFIARIFTFSLLRGKSDPDSFTQFHQWLTEGNTDSFFQHKPTSMNGPLGFLFGFIPQLLQTAMVFLLAHLTISTQVLLNLPIRAMNWFKDGLYNLTHTKKLHGLFPTLKQAEKSPDTVYSDHLPLIAKIPFDKANTFRMMTYNMLGKSAFSGLHHYSNKTWEDDNAFKARYTRIAKSIAKTASNNPTLSMIFLQEVSEKADFLNDNEPDFTTPLLKEKLGNEWTVLKTDGRKITCFRNTDWELISDQNIFSTHHVVLRHKETKNIVKFHNVWGYYNEFPQQHEEQYRELLQDNSEGQVLNVVMGDTNSRIAPLHDYPENITTGAIPPFADEVPKNASDNELQRADHPDGGFYCYPKAQKIHQLKTHVIDPQVGNIFVDTDRSRRRKVFNKYRMVLCLDHSYTTKKIINNQTLFEYEKWLQARYGDSAIIVRSATTSFNDKGLGIRFSPNSAVYQALYPLLENEAGFQMEHLMASKNASTPNPCIFCPLDKVDVLHNAIEQVTIVKNQAPQQEQSGMSPNNPEQRPPKSGFTFFQHGDNNSNNTSNANNPNLTKENYSSNVSSKTS